MRLAAPALAHGGGSHGHGRSSRSFGPATTRMLPGARSIASPAPLARMLVTTALGAPAMTTKGPTTSAVADRPAADPPAPSAAAATTSQFGPSTIFGVGTTRGGGPNLSQFNTGTLDSATPAVSAPMTTEIATTAPITTGAQILEAEILGAQAAPTISTPMTTDITSITPTATGPQLLGVNGLILTNAATSGAVAQAPTTAAISSVAIIGSQGEVIATSGGSSLIGGGATGRTMPECMEAWDKATHMTKNSMAAGLCSHHGARTLTGAAIS